MQILGFEKWITIRGKNQNVFHTKVHYIPDYEMRPEKKKKKLNFPKMAALNAPSVREHELARFKDT